LTVTVSTFMLAACGQMPSQQMRMGEVTALSMPAPALKTAAYEHAQL
jgi:Ca-activated chloride channel family protein